MRIVYNLYFVKNSLCYEIRVEYDLCMFVLFVFLIIESFKLIDKFFIDYSCMDYFFLIFMWFLYIVKRIKDC